MPTAKDKGIYCRQCHKWFKFSDFRIEWDFELPILRLWVHKSCGSVCREDDMEEVNAANRINTD
jgi:hypothetical protein